MQINTKSADAPYICRYWHNICTYWEVLAWQFSNVSCYLKLSVYLYLQILFLYADILYYLQINLLSACYLLTCRLSVFADNRHICICSYCYLQKRKKSLSVGRYADGSFKFWPPTAIAICLHPPSKAPSSKQASGPSSFSSPHFSFRSLRTATRKAPWDSCYLPRARNEEAKFHNDHILMPKFN